MRKLSTKVRHFVMNNKWWSAAIGIVVLSILLYMIFGRSSGALPETVTAARRDITEEVSATGNVKPLSDVDLSFQIGGQVSNIAVAVGDKVYQGEYLASVSNADLSAAVEQAKASLKAAQANLASLQSGSTPQAIAVSQSQVSKSQSDLTQAQIGLINAINSAYTQSDDAIRNKTDVMINNPQTQSPTLDFQTDFSLANQLTSGRVTIESMLTSWDTLTASSTDNASLQTTITTATNNLAIIKSFLDNLALAVNNLSNTSVSQTTLSTWKTNISTARTNIALAITSLAGAVDTYQTTLSALTIAQSQLSVTTAGATTDQLNAQQAVVDGAQANVDSAEAAYNKSIIVSPIDGVVSNIPATVGEVTQPGVTAVSVISYGQYEVDSYIPEADIAKIAVAQFATTTLDAYSSDVVFKTQVIKIDPAETVIEGVPTYKVTLKFIGNDNRIKSGMTANLDILTNFKQGVIAVPARSVYTADNTRYVQLVDPKDPTKTTEQVVTTGIRGVDGFIEVVSGLNVGDTIVSSPNV